MQWLKLWLPRWSRGVAEGKENAPGIIEGVIVLTIARVKTVNICFITPQTFLNTVLLCYNPRTTRMQTAKTFTVLHVVSCNPKWLQTINLSSSCRNGRLGTARRVLVFGLAHGKPVHYHTANRCTITRPSSSKTKTYHVTRSKPMKRHNICKGCYNIKHCEKRGRT